MPTHESGEFGAELALSMEKLGRDVNKLLGASSLTRRPPEILYHFTDCDGLIGILQSRGLWASLATALNDASETRYAVSRAHHLTVDEPSCVKHIPPGILRDFLSGAQSVPGLNSDSRAYVSSFCGAAEAFHWLHYGRSGTGVAIGFKSDLLQFPQFQLWPVVYEQSAQDELISQLLGRVDRFAGQFLSRLTGNDRDAFLGVCGHLVAGYLRLLAPRMKNPAFRSEDEWRIVSNERWVLGEAPEPTRPTLFRSGVARIVPYKQIVFGENSPIAEIVLGASSPMQDGEQALAVLMENTIGTVVPIRRSPVRVRP